MLLLAGLLLSCATPSESESPPPSPAPPAVAEGGRTDIDIDQLEAASSSGALVIDVRTDAEWATGHVPGAIHLPLSTLNPKSGPLATHDPAVPVYVICESGGRSGRAANSLAEAGFSTVNVVGGTGAWRAAGKPLTVP